ncbi:protein translocase subunit SecF [Patescibacteria group bacterium]|nr:protein translocase subunit SecF [Patescibacteria group bacterium]MBU2633493.1 protein translocase subunit SecF [Patescibacteria group bacterium]
MIKHRKIFYMISGLLVAMSLGVFIVWGLNPAIDFTGGSLLEVEYSQVRPPMNIIKEKVDAQNLGNVLIQPIGEKGFLFRFRDITENEHQALIQTLGEVTQKRFDSIGPIIGKELTRKAWTSIVLVVAMIILFIAYAFRKVSKPVSSWKYGSVAIVALIHDVAIPVGVFCVLGYFYHIEVDILFVTALLTILGFSVHDTIVVFDRVRENLKKGTGKDFEDTVSQSVRQVRGRSIKTSLAILLVLVSLLVFGGETTKYFALTLMLGIVLGTYSSLFLASPLLVTWQKWQERK